MTDNVEALKAALRGVAESVSELPTAAVTNGYQQALVSFNSLTTGSNNPNANVVRGLIQQGGETARTLEAHGEDIQAAVNALIASM